MASEPDQRAVATGWLAPAVASAVGTAGLWLVLVPLDWAEGEPWSAIAGSCLLSGLVVLLVARFRPRPVLAAPLGALGALVILYVAAALRAPDGAVSAWPFGLMGVVVPVGLLGTFGGTWLALRLRPSEDGHESGT